MKLAALVAMSLTIGVIGTAPGARAQDPPRAARMGDIGVTAPVVITDAKPNYTAEAMRAGIAGSVLLECIVQPDGTVAAVQVRRPLDPGLDTQAVRALEQWRFRPGQRDGKAVPVMVEVEMSFSLAAKGPRLDSPEVRKPGTGITNPTLVHDPAPVYPPEARIAGIQGEVRLDCVVLPDGSVGDVRVTKALAPALDAAALRAVRLWRFTPGKEGDTPVPVQVSLNLTFSLR